MTRRKALLIIVGGSMMLAGVAYFYPPSVPNSALAYKTAQVDKGTIATVVTATGSLEPVLSVEVGSEVSGTILSVHADFNSSVNEGDVIARIAPEPFQARLDQAKASFLRSKASLAQARADLMLKTRTYNRAKTLLSKGYISEADLDVARAAFESARAQVDLSNALVNEAAASVDAARLDLQHTIIYSPVDGIVINRKISPGQTVAASFQTPALFVIAEDLMRMRVIAHVGEADIGEVTAGQATRFTVDAYPDREFPGTVTQVRIASTSEAGVVTYDVAIDVDNPNLLLKPGMTADVEIVVQASRDVLRIPNSALRFTPPKDHRGNTPTNHQAIADTGSKAISPAQSQTVTRRRPSSVWVPSGDGDLKRVSVSVGITDGRFTEVLDGSLKHGDLVIVGIELGRGKPESLRLPPWLR